MSNTIKRAQSTQEVWKFESLSAEARSSLDHWFEKYDNEDPLAQHCVIGLFDVLRAHYLICDFFVESGEGLFQAGPRDLGLLESAVSRQQAIHFGEIKWNSEIEKISSLFFGLVKDHPFHDANKRTAFLVTLYALRIEKYTPTITDRVFEDFTVQIANGDHRKRAKYKQLRDKYSDADASVYYISSYIEKNFRKVDKKKYIITYRELNELLKSHGYELCNPDGNYIDVIRRVERRTLWGFGPKEQIDQRVRKIGFPGWTREVGKNLVEEVREATGLSFKDGYDSAAFFRGADPAAALISRYQSALTRLAYR